MAEFLETLKGYWWLVTGPLWLGLLGVVWWLKTQFATKIESEKQFAAVNKAIADIGADVETYADQAEVRLTRLEAATKHLPDREAFHALTIQVERQSAMIAAMVKTQDSTAAGVARLEDYMMMRGDKS